MSALSSLSAIAVEPSTRDTLAAAAAGRDILPEHEAQWPATAEVNTLVIERYDATSSTSHEIGRDAGGYPSWRIEQIAQALGIATERRSALLARSQATPSSPLAASASRLARPLLRRPVLPERTADESTPPALAIAGPRQLNQGDQRPQCEQCGQRFDLWRKWGPGKLATTRLCSSCFGKKMSARRAAVVPPTVAPVTHIAPVVPPATSVVPPADEPPTSVIQPRARWVPVIPQAAPAHPQTFLERPGPEENLLFGLLDLLPATARWSLVRRDTWLTAFTATLDLLIQIDTGMEPGMETGREREAGA